MKEPRAYIDELNKTNKVAEKGLTTALSVSTVVEDAAGGLRDVATSIADINHSIEAKINFTFMSQITALVAAGGTAMALGVYVIYLLISYKVLQCMETPHVAETGPNNIVS